MSRLIVIVVTMLLAASCFAAQPEKPTELYLATGGSFPSGDFNIKYNFGFNGSVGVGFKLAPMVRVIPKVEFQTFYLDPNAFLDSVTGGDYVAFMTGVDVRFFKDVAHWPVDPVVEVGGGMALASVGELVIGQVLENAYTETKFYINVGAGFDVRVSPTISAYALGRYVRISTGATKQEFFPISVGIRFPI